MAVMIVVILTLLIMFKMTVVRVVILKWDYIKDDSGEIEDIGGLNALIVPMLQLVLRQGSIAVYSITSSPPHT